MAELKATFSGDATNLNQVIGQLTAKFNSLRGDLALTGAAIRGVKDTFSLMASAANVLSAPLAALRKSLDLGSALSSLSAQSGASVHDLVVLQQAFRNSGIGAEKVGSTIAKLQKSLSEVNEEGESTTATFRRLGTSSEELRGLSSAQQLQKISAGFSGISSAADRAAISQSLFGKSGAEMLRIFTNTSALKEAEAEVGGLADVMEQSATTFNEISNKLNTVSQKAGELASGALSVFAPQLLSTLDKLSKTDLTSVGQAIGSVISPIISAVQFFAQFKTEIAAVVIGLSLMGAKWFVTTRILSTGAFQSTGIIRNLWKEVLKGPLNFSVLREAASVTFGSIKSSAMAAGAAIKSAFVFIGVVMAFAEIAAAFGGISETMREFHNEIVGITREMKTQAELYKSLVGNKNKAGIISNGNERDDAAKKIDGDIESASRKLEDLEQKLKDTGGPSWWNRIEKGNLKDLIKQQERVIFNLRLMKRGVDDISKEQMELNANEKIAAQERRDAASRSDEVRKEIPKLEKEIAEIQRKAALEEKTAGERRLAILEEAKVSSADELQNEIANLEKKQKSASAGVGSFTNEEALRLHHLLGVKKELFQVEKDIKKVEESRKDAIRDINERIRLTQLETDAIINKNTREVEYFKRESEFEKNVEELKKKGLSTEESIAKASALRYAQEVQAITQKNEAETKSIEEVQKENRELEAQISKNTEINSVKERILETQKKILEAEAAGNTDLSGELRIQIGLLEKTLGVTTARVGSEKTSEAFERSMAQQANAQMLAQARMSAEADDAMKTEAQRGAARLAQLEQEHEYNDRILAQLQARAALLANDPEHRAALDGLNQQIASLKARNIENEKFRREQQMQLTFGGQLALQFKDMFDQTALSFKNFAETMASAWQSAAESVASGLTDVIFQANSLREAMRAVATTIVKDLVTSFIRMAIQYVAQKTFMFAMDTVFSAKRVAMAATEGASIATAMAPAAAVTSVATMGGGAASGLLMAAVAIAGIVALIAGLRGFATGGLIPGPSSGRDNRIARVATGEYIVRSAAVSHYGPGIFAALNDLRLPRRSLDDMAFPLPRASSSVAFAGGGLVGPPDPREAAQARETKVSVGVLNTREDMLAFMRGDGRKSVVDIVKGASWQLGMAT